MNAHDDATSTDLVEYGRKSPALVEKIAVVQEAAHASGVELDVPAEQVAAVALELRISDEQLDALMLARQDDQAEFAVMETLLRSGFTPDQIHAAHYLVSDFTSHTSSGKAQRDLREIVVPRSMTISPEILEEATSLEAMLQEATEAEEIASSTSEGTIRMIESRRNKYVAMFCVMLSDIEDLGREIYDLESLRAMFVTLIERALKYRLVNDKYTELQAIAHIYAYATKNGLHNYDDIMRSIERKQ